MDIGLERWYTVYELHGKTCEELASIAHISATLREEEAGSKTLLLIISTGDGAGDCGLSRPS